MPKQVPVYHCLLISPSDVARERGVLTESVNKWNAHIGKILGARIELVKWESHATPAMGDGVQEVINEQLLGDCDLGLAIFWSRLGTPTEKYPSGSVEEIYRLVEKRAPVMIYFKDAPISQQAALQGRQFAELSEMREQFQQQGLLSSFVDDADLREKVQLHLTSTITKMIEADRESVTETQTSPNVLTAPRPDIRVLVNNCFPESPLGLGKRQMLCIKVENHSPNVVYIESLRLEWKDKQSRLIDRDVDWNEWRPTPLNPWESFEVPINPYEFASPKNLAGIMVVDGIGGHYRTSEDNFSSALERFFKNEADLRRSER